jgi:anti-sigma factor (TIGR02949 family)
MTDHTRLNCEALLGSLSEYIDGELSPELCREIEKHLAGCENCRVVLNTTKRTIDLVQSPTEAIPVPDDVRERLFKRLNLDDYLKPKPQAYARTKRENDHVR